LALANNQEDGLMLEARSLPIRRWRNSAVTFLATLGAALGLGVLIWILIMVIHKGIRAYDWNFFTELPTPPGMDGGGLANAIIGTLILTVLATLFGTPIGIVAGIYIAEQGKGSKLASLVRFLTNTLIGVPSIIIGVFIYTLVVMPMKNFSGLAGALSLAVIMLPIIVRTTEDMLNMVPNSLREAGLALGAPRWRVTLDIVFRSARGGLLTGVLLAVARVSGETAPLLFTTLNSPYWIHSLNEPIANLTVTIFNYAMSPYADWKEKAWGASLLIMAAVLFLNIISRLAFKTKTR
jgi:phosphate transport system permease protein